MIYSNLQNKGQTSRMFLFSMTKIDIFQSNAPFVPRFDFQWPIYSNGFDSTCVQFHVVARTRLGICGSASVCGNLHAFHASRTRGTVV